MYRVQSSMLLRPLRVVPSFYEVLLFQVLQLTTLVIRGPATQVEKIIITLDRVTIKEEEVRGVLLCVQDSVRSPFGEVYSQIPV